MEKDCLYFEKLSFNTHPCLAEEAYDGWLLRYAEGYTKRANSVNVVGVSTGSFVEKIKKCEEKYGERNLPAVFKITPMASELDEVLEERGYTAVDKTNVMTVDLTKKGKPESKGKAYNKGKTAEVSDEVEMSVIIEEKFTESWQYYYFTFNKVSPSSVPTAKKIQAKITNPVLCATVYVDKKAVACGLGVMEQGYVGLLDIVVKEEYRGCGFGKVLCKALLEKGKEGGATTGYLQVGDSNEVAKRLYNGLGFEDIYSYWYRVKC
ncbi:MAG: GNAT family N-acetyltransferase [Lachnospiraceae bacterium]|nr:GNAT family N-acetyltransferase [Lachnospiraceae bacterium]